MLLDNFFYILELHSEEQKLRTLLRIDRHHKIFNGHFPAIPIVPGVCMMEMIREIIEKYFDRKLMVNAADNVKFLAVINPVEHAEVQADIDYENLKDGGLKVNATIFAGDLIFFKLKATLQSAL